MNEFERRLKAQPFRELPPKWRAGILSSGASSRPKETETGWRDWLWPSPMVWGAMAAVWIVLLFVQLDAGLWADGPQDGSAAAMSDASNPTPPTPSFHLTSADNPLFASLR